MGKEQKADLGFETSRELKRLFNEELDTWKKRTRYGLDDLARSCGVSPAYLAHVGRYGRIPGKPVLILLALHFAMKNPQRIFDAAGVREAWPLDPEIGLGKSGDEQSGFLSVRLDMNGLANALRDIVRAEIKPRSVGELLRNRPLRIGVNPRAFWFFSDFDPDKNGPIKGFFSEFCDKLALALQCRIDMKIVDFSVYPDLFARDELDLFGPVVEAPNLPSGTTFTSALYRIGMSALWRKSKSSGLADLPAPRSIDELNKKDYKITVIRNTRAHLLANTLFHRPDSELIICNSHEEALERVLFRGIKNSAHIFIVNTVEAKIWQEEHKSSLQLLFHEPEQLIDMADGCIAVRADWPELATAINDFTHFLERSGALAETFKRWAPPKMSGVLEPVTSTVHSKRT